MDVSRILDVTSIREDSDWEFKSARGGLPGSLWETYSAMANTDGGTIVLGVEDDGTISGLNNPAKMQSDFWRSPRIQQRTKPDRVTLTLSMLSLLPEDSLERLRARFGKRFGQLSSTEVQALVTAYMEGAVTNPRLQEICNDHPADISRILQGLAIQGFLLQEGQRRWASYRLPPEEDSSHKPGTPHTVSSSSLHIGGDSSLSLGQLTEEERNQLNRIAAPAATSSRLALEETRRIILTLCQGIFFTAYELGQLMNRNPNSLRNRFLTPLVEEGLLTRKYPADPNRPDQAYTTTASLKIEN